MIELPLHVMITKNTRFTLNLNQYRGANYHVVTKAKIKYKDLIWRLIPNKTYDCPVELIYTYYHGRKGRVDISNPCSIIDKFTSDVLSEKKIIPDDNSEFIKRVTYQWGGVDKNNPRCELIIKSI